MGGLRRWVKLEGGKLVGKLGVRLSAGGREGLLELGDGYRHRGAGREREGEEQERDGRGSHGH